MTENLTVRYTIPISDEEWGGPSVAFYKWLPDGEAEALVRERDDLTTRLWLNRDCVASLGKVDDDTISRWVNITISKVYIEVFARNVSDELARFIYDERESWKNIHHGLNPESEEYKKLSDQYHDLAVKVLEQALALYNRFIAFVRNYKHQFWLPERPIKRHLLSSQNVSFQAQVRSEDYGWVTWYPKSTASFTVYVSDDDDVSIKKEDWSEIQKFIASDSRPNLILELLANAQLLIQENKRRSAIIEAVSALEIAVSEFAESPRIDSFVTEEFLSRMEVNSVGSQIEHLGFSGTVRYLLPILFPREILSTEILNNCQQAIEVRNNVIHHGQRDVNSSRIRPLVSSIRSACEILAQYTNQK